jgi:hypothetical protein
MYYFQQLLNTAIGGIDATKIIPTVINIAFAILLVGFLIGVYQAALHGGDLQALAVTAIKYLVVAMILANWSSVFRDVNGSFTAVANFIGNSSGAKDMFLNWMTQLQQQATSNPNLTFWSMITGDQAGTLTVLLLLVAYLLYALAIIIFCFFYTLFGTALYVLGPLVLALVPISGIGQLGKTYAVNLMIWNAWGILYAVFGAMITAIHFNQVSDVLGNGFLGFLKGVPDSMMLGLVSIFYALSIALIPFIAKRIISGDVGSSAFALVRAGAVAAGAALAGVSGFAAGASTPAFVASGSSSLGGGASSNSPGMASSMPPPTPSPATSMSSFLRSGIASVSNNQTSSAPPTPTPNTDGAGKSNGGGRPTASGTASSYRPHSITQVITFNVGRALGKAAGRNNADNN